MLFFKLPHAQVTKSNPVFNAGLEGVRHLRSARSLARYTLIVVIIPFIVLASWWLLTMLTYAQTPKVQRWDFYTNFGNVTTELIIVLLFAALIVALALDIYTISLTANSIRREIKTGEVTALRKTKAANYLAAKSALALVRAWRVLALEVAVRVLIVVAVFMAFSFTDNCFIGDDPAISSTCGVIFILNAGPEMILLLGVAAGLGAIFILESFWRMHILTALGLLISVIIHDRTMAGLGGVAAIIGVHLLQGVVIFAAFQFLQGHSPFLNIGVVGVMIIVGVRLYRTVSNIATNSLDRIAIQTV